MTLHLSQIFLTDALTFITPHVTTETFVRPAKPQPGRNSLVAVHNPSAIQVVGRKFDRDFVSWQNADEILAHLAGNVRQYLVFIFELHLEHGIGQRLDHRCHHFNRVFFAHRLLRFSSQFPVPSSQHYLQRISLRTENRELRTFLYWVKITGPCRVTATQCSKWAL